MRFLLFVGLIFLLTPQAFAQHEGHNPPPTKPAPAKPAPAKPAPAKPAPAQPAASPTASPSQTEESMHAGMDHGLLVVEDDEMFVRVGDSHANLMPMGRMGSGTAWQPASSTMPMLHKQADDWLLMFHYNFVAGVNAQGGPRGVTKFESANWFMPSATRGVGQGTLELRGLFCVVV